ncbi:rod shape-determining protein MreC [Leptolyngbya sp. O-77]|uniref:rod shape-determining protein MreC n=1 Tax=Leptolyngbya sp. O-77 TaxID=1080068 RepID=UPI00074D459E|nr:rod shape-determining protein MreC [Leptolyngbya sp. O-77]BAU43670.1 Cell shape-determining protein MreC [Leptolyngbya sp. O-77]
MYVLRRWWGKNGLRLGLAVLALSTAWMLRQTQGAFVLELYRAISAPFQAKGPTRAEILDNAQVQELQQRLIELESQNRRLQELLNYNATQPQPGIAAPIIGRSADHWWQQVTLGRGRRDGVKVGSIVSGTGGLVGRVVQVTANTSRVLLVSDPTSRIGVTVSRSRFMGYMRGQSGNRAVMEFFEKVPDVKPGDVVSTSSFSQLFPPGLPVGRVESIDFSKSPAPEAIVELSAPISTLDWVLVAPNPKPAATEPPPPPSPLPDSTLP